MTGNLKTSPELLERLKASASKPMTRDELERQRVSFVYGNLPHDSGITRDQVAQRLRKNAGE